MKERKEHLSSWRRRLVDFAPNVDTTLGNEYLKEVALLFNVSEQVVRADAEKENFRKTRSPKCPGSDTIEDPLSQFAIQFQHLIPKIAWLHCSGPVTL